MQRVVGTLGWSMVFLALASCSSGSPPAGGSGGKTGTGGTGTGSGGTTPGSGGNTGTGGSSAGTGGTVGTGGSGTGGTVGSGGSGSGGSVGTGGSGSGGTVGTGGSGTGGTVGSGGAAGGRGGNVGVGGGAVGTGGNAGSTGSAGSDGGDWVPLFNGKDLTGWTPGATGTGLFAVDSTGGEPAIHVYPTQADGSNADQAHLRTNDSYSSYVFHAEYKWGFKRFAGRAKNARDNGICWHVVLPAPTNDQWPTSIEFQLGSDTWPNDWVSGHIFMLVDKTRAQWPYAPMMGQNEVYSPTSTTKKMIGAPMQYYKALSIPPNQNKGGLVSATAAATEWNVVELTVHGSKDASYNVNGTVVNGLTNMEYNTGNGTFAPLDHGPIALQAEFAEAYFRNVKIKILPAN